MATLKTIKRNHRSESLRGKFMVDTVRGVLRIRKWPKKRGTPKSALQLWWIDWFRQANKLAKYADAMSMRLAIKYTAGTGIYPRDLLLKAMRGRLYTWRDENGRMYYPMAGVQDISDSLDVVAQEIGSVLVRAIDRWRNAESGAAGKVLTHQGAAQPPSWQAPAAGGSGVAALLTLTSNPTIANGVFTPIIWGTEEYDVGGYVDLAANPTRFTAPAGVNYARLSGNVAWANNGNGDRIVTLYKNGAQVPGSGWVRDPNSDGLVGQNFASAIIPWAEDDYLELVVYQASGGGLSFEATAPALTYACLESW